MKTTILLSLLFTATALAQDANVQSKTTQTAAEANREEQRKLDAERKTQKALEEQPITSSGFLVELSRAEKKSKFLSLRQPADPKNDYKYLHLDEKTQRPKGFVLFALDF